MSDCNCEFCRKESIPERLDRIERKLDELLKPRVEWTSDKATLILHNGSSKTTMPSKLKPKKPRRRK